MSDDRTQLDPRPCPSCGTVVEPLEETYPFCSERCRLVDLGRWMDERYRIQQRDPDQAV
jgi:hypothetical protein